VVLMFAALGGYLHFGTVSVAAGGASVPLGRPLLPGERGRRAVAPPVLAPGRPVAGAAARCFRAICNISNVVSFLDQTALR